jgi:Peptidase family M1 domain
LFLRCARTRACAATLALWTASAAAQHGAELAQPSSQHYQIEARLDPSRRAVQGKLRLAFTNHASRALGELYFHLYLNAFRDERSVFMRESRGQLRGLRAHGAGRIALSSLRVDGADLLASAERELVPDDFTQLKVPLQSAIAPGAVATIDVEFEAKLPPIFARAGYDADFYAIAQWFPKLAKLEPDGRFASFPYHGLGEFYSDFADYDLHLRTPSSFRVGASGALISEQRRGAETARHFRARRVHDVAWVAGPDLVARKQQIEQVEVSFLAPAGYEQMLQDQAAIVRHGLRRFGAQYGPYPYPTLTVVVPPRGADGAAGMEYPTLIVVDGGWLPLPLAPALSGVAVSAHELAHQWFYGLLASDEVRHPVLDEGISEWATLDLLRAVYGDSEPLWKGPRFERFELMRAAVFRFGASISPGLPAPDYALSEYGPSVYGRAALALETVRRAHGQARFAAALARYARDNRFGHPTPAALGAAFDAVYGAGFAQAVLFPLLLRGERSEVRIVEATSTREAQRFRTHVHARREGVALPTWVCAYDAAGRELARKPWPAPAPTLRTDFETAQPVARVVLDPERALLLDADARDQVWVFEPRPSSHVLGQLIAALQAGFSWIGP